MSKAEKKEKKKTKVMASALAKTNEKEDDAVVEIEMAWSENPKPLAETQHKRTVRELLEDARADGVREGLEAVRGEGAPPPGKPRAAREQLEDARADGVREGLEAVRGEGAPPRGQIPKPGRPRGRPAAQVPAPGQRGGPVDECFGQRGGPGVDGYFGAPDRLEPAQGVGQVSAAAHNSVQVLGGLSGAVESDADLFELSDNEGSVTSSTSDSSSCPGDTSFELVEDSDSDALVTSVVSYKAAAHPPKVGAPVAHWVSSDGKKSSKKGLSPRRLRPPRRPR
jgi:hypothetical protein